MQQDKPSNLNLPNALTTLRLLLIPVFLYLMAQNRMMPALFVFVFASLTDILDGWIARHYNLITDFGKLFDPLADKLMVLSVMGMLTCKGIIPLPAVILLLAKECLMLLGGYLLLKKKVVVYSEHIGKIAQFTTVLALMLSFFHEEFRKLGHPIHIYLLWLGVVLALLSMVYYLRRNGPKLFSPANHPEPSIKDQEEDEIAEP